MGVHGLWQLLHPAGQPVTLESLEGKILAVDISIWLHQTMKGMRDKDGNPLPNAHLQGLFSRICKLLFYRIKPIFVFDGDVPALKKQTMAARRERRAEAERESNEISQKLLQNLIKSQAVRQTLGDIGSSHQYVPGVKRGRNQPDRDMFELAPLAEPEEIGLALNAEEWDRDFELQKSWIKEGLAAVSDSHPDSEEFRSLPAEIQHEVLSELKEQKKYHSLSRINKMPEDSTDFSSYQLKKLMRQSKLTARIDEVRKQMTSNTAGDIACSLVDEYHGDEVEARRIVSEDSAHYVLIKGLTKKRQQEEADRYEIHSHVKLEKVDPEDSDNAAERLAGDRSLMEDTTQPRHIDTKVKSSGIISSDSDSDFNNYINSRLQKKRRQKSKPTRSGMKTDLDPSPVYHNSAGHIVSECEVMYSNKGQLASSDICTSEDEGFIEVRIDPSAAVDDDLFPASIFQTDINRICRKQNPTAAVSEHHPENVASASSDLIQTKNNLMELNSFEKLSTGLAEGDSQDELGDVASSSADFGEITDHFPHQASETDDDTARRKNVLNEILKQLEQKKKILSDSQLDDCGDTTLQISKDETRQVNHGSDISDSLIVKKSESKDFVSQYGGASCSKALSPEVTFAEAQDSSGGFLIDTLEESNSLSESDELKIAIELSLQTNRPENNMCLQTVDCSLSGSLENNVSTNLLKHHNVEDTGSALLKLQEVDKELHTKVTFDLDNDTEDFVEVESEQILIGNPSITSEGSADSETDVQEDTDADKSQDSGEFTRTITDSSESFHNQLHSPAVLEKQQVESSSNLLQPEDYGIDNYEMFQIMDQSNLEDVRTRLESERSALMSERGRHTRMATSITEQTNLEAQELLQLFGIPFIVSPMEAEAQCAYLDITNQTAGTITDDSDIWLFGGRRMYKNFFNQSKHVEFYAYDSIYSHFGINRAQLINIALLCGSDYTEGIQGVGPVRALEIMAEFPGDGLEGLYSFRNWWSRTMSQTFTSGNKVRARLKDLKVIPGFPSEAVVDAYLHPQVDESMEKFTWGLPDLDQLREFTKYKFGWSKEKADQSLLPMMKQLSKKQSQGRIHMYFQPRHLDKTSKIQSERLKRALASMRNSRQTLQEGDQKQNNIGDSNHTENALEGHTGIKKRKAIGNREDGAGSPSKQKTVRNKQVKQVKKKKVATVEAVKERKLTVEKPVDIIEVVATVAETEPEVMIGVVMKDDTEKLNIEDTEKERVNVEKVTINTQKQVEELKRMTLIKGKKNKPIITEEEQILSRKGKREEKAVTEKKHSHKKFDVKSDISQKIGITIDKGKSRRGRRMKGDKYIGGQGRLPLSLDEKQITRNKHFKRGKPSRERGIVNLSESNSSATDGSSESEQSGMGEFDITQSHHSKTMLSSAAVKGIQEQIAELEAAQHYKAVDTQISERDNAGVTDPTESQCNRLSFAGKKIYQEFLKTDLTTNILPVMSTELTQLKQSSTSGKPDSFGGNEETVTVSRIADVSIINRQNLPSTLSYLNRRSREDQFLLHQLKGGRTVNAVEKRLEERPKKPILENQPHLSTDQTDEQIVSFEDMLSGLDVVTSKSVHGKGKIIASSKKLSTVNVSPVKALQNKIFQQIGQFGSALVGTSSNDISNTTSIKQPDSQGHASIKENHSQEMVHMIHDEKQPLIINKHQITNKQHLTSRTASDEKAVSTCSNASFGSSGMNESSRQINKDRTLKSSRSHAFDKPIGENSSGDYDSDREARKLSKKKKFLKQVEHVGDSKSVKGFGILPRQNAEQAIRIKAGKGKNHTNAVSMSEKLESKNASEDELLEYAFITADDLGSDFSEFDA